MRCCTAARRGSQGPWPLLSLSAMIETASAPLPPYGVFEDFLPDSERATLLAWAISEEASFKPAKIVTGPGGSAEDFDPAVRNALTRSGGPYKTMVSARLLSMLPRIMAAAGYRGAEPRSLEFQMNAYGDGGHYGPHFDTPLGPGRRPLGKGEGEDRVISAVYYFFREPKAFTGGALRLYRFGTDPEACEPDDSIAFEPVQNRLVVFPAWARHGVDRVACPSGEFEDYRFALNCWFCRQIAA